MSGVDFSVTCVSCRKDEPDSGPLTTFFFNSTQSKHKVKITFLAALPALRIAALWPVNHFRIQIPWPWPKEELNIVMSGQFRTLAMFFLLQQKTNPATNSIDWSHLILAKAKTNKTQLDKKFPIAVCYILTPSTPPKFSCLLRPSLAILLFFTSSAPPGPARTLS